MRVPTMNDVEAYHAVFQAKTAMRFIGDGSINNDEQVTARIQRAKNFHRELGFCLWAMELTVADAKTGAPAGTVIGDCGLVPVAAKGPEIELAYRLNPAYWGCGYATEAAGSALLFGLAQAGLDEVIAVAYSQNKASLGVLNKIGMQHEGVTDRYYDTQLELFRADQSFLEQM